MNHSETSTTFNGTLVAPTESRGTGRPATAMINLKRILCPTDFSPQSDQALRYALALTCAYESEIVLCHRPDAAESYIRQDRLADSLPARAKEQFERPLLRFLTTRALDGLDWRGLLIDGEDVGEAITKAAAAQAADLIIMRSRRRPTRAALLGSTAESVCRTAPCPVLVTHSDEREWVQPLSRNISLDRVLVPYDFSDYSELALTYALSLAQEYQAELHLLHVLPPHTVTQPEISWYPLKNESAYHNAAQRLRRSIPGEAYLWCKVTTAVSEGHAYREILNYAEKNEIDLISIGAHGAGFGMQTLFGSNVDRVLRQAPCPVLVARPLKPTLAVHSQKSKVQSLAI